MCIHIYTYTVVSTSMYRGSYGAKPMQAMAVIALEEEADDWEQSAVDSEGPKPTRSVVGSVIFAFKGDIDRVPIKGI